MKTKALIALGLIGGAAILGSGMLKGTEEPGIVVIQEPSMPASIPPYASMADIGIPWELAGGEYYHAPRGLGGTTVSPAPVYSPDYSNISSLASTLFPKQIEKTTPDSTEETIKKVVPKPTTYIKGGLPYSGIPPKGAEIIEITPKERKLQARLDLSEEVMISRAEREARYQHQLKLMGAGK